MCSPDAFNMYSVFLYVLLSVVLAGVSVMGYVHNRCELLTEFLNVVLLVNFIQISQSMEVLLMILYLIVSWKKLWYKPGGLFCLENAIA